MSVYGDGCIGMVLRVDIHVNTLIDQMYNPVGGGVPHHRGQEVAPGMTKREVEALRLTFRAIVLDEVAMVEEVEGKE